MHGQKFRHVCTEMYADVMAMCYGECTILVSGMNALVHVAATWFFVGQAPQYVPPTSYLDTCLDVCMHMSVHRSIPIQVYIHAYTHRHRDLTEWEVPTVAWHRHFAVGLRCPLHA